LLQSDRLERLAHTPKPPPLAVSDEVRPAPAPLAQIVHAARKVRRTHACTHARTHARMHLFPLPLPRSSCLLSLLGGSDPIRRCCLDPRSSFLQRAPRRAPQMMAVARSAGERVGTPSTPTACAPHRSRVGLGETLAEHLRAHLPTYAHRRSTQRQRQRQRLPNLYKQTNPHGGQCTRTRAVHSADQPSSPAQRWPTSAAVSPTDGPVESSTGLACALICRQRRPLRYAHQYS
jgi:hypothetical protein